MSTQRDERCQMCGHERSWHIDPSRWGNETGCRAEMAGKACPCALFQSAATPSPSSALSRDAQLRERTLALLEALAEADDLLGDDAPLKDRAASLLEDLTDTRYAAPPSSAPTTPNLCACGHQHCAGTDGEDGGCKDIDCPCAHWRPAPPPPTAGAQTQAGGLGDCPVCRRPIAEHKPGGLAACAIKPAAAPPPAAGLPEEVEGAVDAYRAAVRNDAVWPTYEDRAPGALAALRAALLRWSSSLVAAERAADDEMAGALERSLNDSADGDVATCESPWCGQPVGHEGECDTALIDWWGERESLRTVLSAHRARREGDHG